MLLPSPPSTHQPSNLLSNDEASQYNQGESTDGLLGRVEGQDVAHGSPLASPRITGQQPGVGVERTARNTSRAKVLAEQRRQQKIMAASQLPVAITPTHLLPPLSQLPPPVNLSGAATLVSSAGYSGLGLGMQPPGSGRAMSSSASVNSLAASENSSLLNHASSYASLNTMSGGAAQHVPVSISYGAIPKTQLPAHLFHQEIIIDDDLSIKITGYRIHWASMLFYRFFNIITLGITYLLSRWMPRMEIFLTATPCAMDVATVVGVENQWGELSIEKVRRDAFPGGVVADVFPDNPIGTVDDLLYSPNAGAPRPRPPGSPRSPMMPILIYFDYHLIKFIFNPVTGLFETTQYWKDVDWKNTSRVLDGVNGSAVVARRRLIFGENAVTIREKPTLKLLMDEVLHPFFIFQILSMILWSLDEYYYYAACILIISVMSTASTLFETKKTMRRLRDMSRFSCEIRAWRGGVWKVMKSEDLVPGDVFEITPNLMPLLPCDCILLDGDCIVNESMLTGESIPVSKTPITDDELVDIDFEEEDPANSTRMARFFMFSGTKVIRSRGGNRGPNDPEKGTRFGLGEPGALAVVVRVGFNTTKGALVRSILFPKPNTFKFYRDSFRFIGVLGMVAFLGFLASLYNFFRLGNAWTTIVVRALDLITIVVPPALPATMAIGTSFAISRLRRGMIYCTSPPRVNICGKIEMMCFDKTGTLTQEGLDVLGFRFTVPNVAAASVILAKPHPHAQVMEGSPTRAPSQMHRHQPSPPRAVIIPSISQQQGLRFSDLYRSVDDVVAQERMRDALETPSPVAPVGVLPSHQQPHTRRFSSSSVNLAAVPGHPNGSEPDFPYPMIVCAMATCHSLKVVA
ncbi:hypothetical protein HK101_009383, partial [Irineochytrium annulatum]